MSNVRFKMAKYLKSKNCKVCFSILLIGILSAFVLAGQIWEIVQKVRTGHGLDYYTTMWGYELNYIGTLVLFIIIAILFLLSPLIYWFATKEERSFKQKYGINEK